MKSHIQSLLIQLAGEWLNHLAADSPELANRAGCMGPITKVEVDEI